MRSGGLPEIENRDFAMIIGHWNFNSSAENELRLKPLCLEVEKHFQIRGRMHRYFAAAEDPYLARENGEHFRGFHCHISQRFRLPPDLLYSFFRSNLVGNTFEEMTAFEHLIYIRQRTCCDPVGCVTTYAHELQHAIQHERTPRLLRVNGALYDNLRQFEPRATAIDIPHEREANIVSKRVAEAVCGAESVRVFAEEQVRLMEQMGEIEQRDRWIFFRDVPSSTPYDLLEGTLPFIQRYRGRMDFGVNVDKPQWWVGSIQNSSVLPTEE
jgi:hypothetical protein